MRNAGLEAHAMDGLLTPTAVGQGPGWADAERHETMKPTLRFARRAVALAALVQALVVDSAVAGPLMTFPAGTFIVPVQRSVYPSGAGDAVQAAPGMLYRFLQRDGVVTYRAIEPEKIGPGAPDFTVSAAAGRVVDNYRGTTAPDGNRVSYIGGAWLIAPQYQADLDAVLADSTWSAVQVHRAAVPFTAPVTAVHQISGRGIALLVSNDAVEAARARAVMEWFLQPSGLAGALATLTPDQIVAGALTGADGPAVLLVPYARPLAEITATDLTGVLGAVHVWLQAGNTLIAQDDAVAFLENQAGGRFLTTGGLGINGVTHDDLSQNLTPATAKQTSLEPGHLVAQTGDIGVSASYCADGQPCVPGSGGLVVTLRPYQTGDLTLAGAGDPVAGSAYRPTVRRLYSWNTDGSGYHWDLAVVGHADGGWANGTVAYLGGRVIPEEGTAGSQISTSLRLIFLNNFYSVEVASQVARVTHAGVTVDHDLILFKGSTSADGRGHLEAYDAATDLTTPLWDAAGEIPGDGGRSIFTHDGSADAAHSPNLVAVTADDPVVAGLLARQEIERLRGRVLDATTGSYLDLANRLGPIDHSTAVAVGPSLLVEGAGERPRNAYVGTLDGLLEAVDAAAATGSPAGSGVEQWALVPRSQIALLAKDGLDADLGVDGSPTVADLWLDHDGDGGGEFRTVLTVPMGASSPHLLALDVTDRATPRVLWELTDRGAVSMGFAAKTAMGHIVQPDTGGNPVRTAVVWVATSKYRQTDSGGLSVYCFRVADGQKLWEFHKLYTRGVNDIPPPVVAVDPDSDGFVETLIAADNEGRLWALAARTGKSLYCNDDPSFCADPKPLYPANNGIDVDRPIGAAPAVVTGGGQLIVLFGTGGYDWAPAEDVAQRFAGVLVPAHGEGIELFDIALEPGERVYASPVVDRNAHFLFLGKSQGRVGGGATPPDTGGTARIQTYDISDALAGDDVDPTTDAGNDIVLGQTLPGGLQLERGALFGATTDGAPFQHGDVGAAGAEPRPEPLGRLYWRVVLLATP